MPIQIPPGYTPLHNNLSIQMIDTDEKTKTYMLQGVKKPEKTPNQLIWTPRLANTAIQSLQTNLQTFYGCINIRTIMESAKQYIQPKSKYQDSAINNIIRQSLYKELYVNNDHMFIFAKDDFIDMTKAAAFTLPPITEFDTSDLLCESGTIIFENVINLRQLFGYDISDDKMGLPIRAITWMQNLISESEIDIIGYVDPETYKQQHYAYLRKLRETNPNKGIVFDPDEAYNSLRISSFAALKPFTKNANGTLDDVTEKMLKFLIALKAINDSSVSDNTSYNPNIDAKKQKKKNKRKSKHLSKTPKLRIVYLNNPKHGKYELDAATGRKQRAHWVRGHWRKQWYPSSQNHKTIWIDGFIKGDEKLGVVSGRKLYVAR